MQRDSAAKVSTSRSATSSSHIEKASLDIEDGSEVAKTGGVPNGWVDGEVSPAARSSWTART